MPLNEIPTHLSPETRRLVDATLEQAWLELKKDAPADAARQRRKFAGAIVALVFVGETNPRSSSDLRCMPPGEGASHAITRARDARRGNCQSLPGHRRCPTLEGSHAACYRAEPKIPC